MKQFTLCLALFLPLAIFAQTGSEKIAPEFDGVKVDSTLSYFITQYTAKGFILEKQDGALTIMHGTLGTDKLTLYIVATPVSKKVWKVVAAFPEQSTWNSLKEKYNSLKEILQSKYGTPTDDFHFFASPYKEGDGDEMTAVEANKCDYMTAWVKEENNSTIDISISILKCPKVSYENLVNSALNKQEKEKATSDGL